MGSDTGAGASHDRFTAHAGAYVASRPSYPAASIAAIFDGLGEPAGLAVADLGAGTGISSRLLADHGPRVLAIEPNAAMRDAARGDPRIEWFEGTAERTTLATRSVDVVAAFQAWHWFDPALAEAEARRIVRGNGKLAIVYNERDERDSFTLQFGRVVRRYATDATERRREDARTRALAIDPARAERNEFAHRQSVDRPWLHARVASTSYLPQSGHAAEELRADLDALFDCFASADAIEIHLMTIVICVAL